MKNSKKKNNTFKRVAAGALSMALVAGALPANVGGFLTGSSGIVAHAAVSDDLEKLIFTVNNWFGQNELRLDEYDFSNNTNYTRNLREALENAMNVMDSSANADDIMTAFVNLYNKYKASRQALYPIIDIADLAEGDYIFAGDTVETYDTRLDVWLEDGTGTSIIYNSIEPWISDTDYHINYVDMMQRVNALYVEEFDVPESSEESSESSDDLSDLYNEASAWYEENVYSLSDQTAADLSTALNSANTVITDTAATNEAISEAYDALEAAYLAAQKDAELAVAPVINAADVKLGMFLPAGTTINVEGFNNRYISVGNITYANNQIVDGKFKLDKNCIVRKTDINESNSYIGISLVSNLFAFDSVEGTLTSMNAGVGYSASYLAARAKTDGTLSWTVGSEDSYDKILILVNGELAVSESGKDMSDSIDISAGDIIVASYAKDSSGNYNGDTATLTPDFEWEEVQLRLGKVKPTNLANSDVTATASTYTGSALTPEIKIGESKLTADTDYTYTVTDANNEAVASVVNAGTYHVTVTAVDGSTYVGAKTVDWTVNKADITITAADELKYNGEEQNLIKGSVPAGTKFSLTAPATAAELIAAEIRKIVQYEDYCGIMADDAQDFEAKMNYQTAGNALSYYRYCLLHLTDEDDGNASYCLENAREAAIGMNGTDNSDAFQYIETYITDTTTLDDVKARFTEQESEWSTTIPTGKDIKTYTVYYKGDGVNYDDTIKSVNVTIGKGDPSVTPPVGSTVSYTGNAVALVTAGSVNVVDGNDDVQLQYRAFTSEEAAEMGRQLAAARAQFNDDQEAGMIAIREIISSYDNDSKWSADIPTKTQTGDYVVCYRVKGNDNYNNLYCLSDLTVAEIVAIANGSANIFNSSVNAKIEYATTVLTLSNLGNNVRVVEIDGDEVTPENGVFNLKGTKKYYIYTNSSIADNDIITGSTTNANYTNGFSYRYAIEIPMIPETGYALSHTNNWTGVVPNSKKDTLYVADGTPDTTDDTQIAAVMQAGGTVYYGDELSTDMVEVTDAFSSVIKVERVYLTKTDGTPVTLDSALPFGTYRLTAEVSVDRDADGFDSDDETLATTDQSITMYKTVTYAARPMNRNNYFLKTEDGLVPLKVTGSTVTVPEYYWVGTPKEDSSNPYIRLEEPDEALSALFTWEKKSTFVYNGTAQKPEIVVKNGGSETIVLADTAVEADETATPPVAAVAKDYTNAVAEKTDADNYTFKLTAEANGSYTGSVTVAWSIAKADISKYIAVAPKNNVDTDTVAGNDSIVYDGEVLDGTDFEVKTNEAYAALAADSPVKALVDEFIAQLKATPAVEADPANNIEAQPAVPAKTVVAAEAANAGEYPKSKNGYPKENTFLVTPKEENSYNFYYSDDFMNSDNTFAAQDDIIIMPKVNDNDESVEFKMYDTNDKFTIIIVYSDGKICYKPYYSDPIFVDATLPNTTEYGWYIEQTGTRVLNQGTVNEKTVNVFTISAKKYPTGELKNAGEHKANVTVSNSNFEPVVFDGDNAIDVTIAKRNVTLTPDDGLSITYRDTAMPDLTYAIEDAKDDGLTGVIAADKALFQKQVITNIEAGTENNTTIVSSSPVLLGTITVNGEAKTINAGAIYVDKLVQEEADANAVYFAYAAENNAIDYTTAGLNDAGKYTYKAIDFDNYVVVFPEEDVPTFTVEQLNLNSIDNLKIMLKGVTGTEGRDWNYDSEGKVVYTYDGSSKQVAVQSVSKKNDTETATAEFNASTSQSSYVALTDGSNLEARSWSYNNGNSCWTVRYGNDINAESIQLTAPEGALIKEVKAYGTAKLLDQDLNKDLFDSDYTVGDGYYSFTDIEANSFTIRANTALIFDPDYSCSKVMVTGVVVTYYYPDDYILIENTDFTVGGAAKRASAGTHEVQIMGKGNYTGVVKTAWDIAEREAEESTLYIDNIASNEYNGKSYDGKAVSADVSFGETASADYVSDAEVDIKYYKGNTLLESAPVDADSYKVVATITCDGYATKTIEKYFNINPAVLSVNENSNTKTITYGNELPAVTQADINAINGLIDTDNEYFQKFFTDGKLAFSYVKMLNPTSQAVVEDTSKLTFTLVGTLTDEEKAVLNKFYANYDVTGLYWNLTTNAKSIKDSSVTVEFTDGDTIILDEGGFVSDNKIIVKDTAILDADGNATVLTDADYELNVEETATEGVYTLELVGKNHYRGVRRVEFTALTEEAAVPKFNINSTVARINNGKIYVGVSYSYDLHNGWTVTDYGILYNNDGTITDASELTFEAAANNSSILTKTGKTGTNLLDTGKGVVAVGYVTAVAPSGTTYTVYSDNIGGKAANITVNEPVTRVNNANQKLYLGVSYGITPASGLTLDSYGILYCTDGTITDISELTLEAAENNSSILTKAGKTGTNLLDTGKGVIAVGYNVVKDSSGKTAVIYTGDIGGRAVKITENAPVARTNNGKEYVGVSYSISAVDGYTVEDYGILYCNDGTITDPAELKLNSINASIQKKEGKTGTNLLDTGKGVVAVGYNVVKNSNNQEAIIYTDNIGGKYADLIG